MTTRRAALLSGLALLAQSRFGSASTKLVPPLSKLVAADPPREISGLAISREDGTAEDLAAYRGKLVVLNLWGSWCFPCRDEMPSLSRLADAAKDLLVAVLPLAIERRGVEAVREFFQQTAISNLPVRLGDGDNIAKVFAAWGLPYTVLIDAQGREVARVTGPAQWDDAGFIAWLTAKV